MELVARTRKDYIYIHTHIYIANDPQKNTVLTHEHEQHMGRKEDVASAIFTGRARWTDRHGSA
jgi:hypothetical protein